MDRADLAPALTVSAPTVGVARTVLRNDNSSQHLFKEICDKIYFIFAQFNDNKHRLPSSISEGYFSQKPKLTEIFARPA